MFTNFPITEKMHIHSLNGELRDATILKRLGDNDYLAKYNDVQCHAIYNVFVNRFYVDDKYGVIKEKTPGRESQCR
jgi:hypothetical protein